MSVPFLAAILFAAAPLAAMAAQAPAKCPFENTRTELRQEEKETPLGKEMSAMNKHFKALKKNVGKAEKKDANVADFNGIADISAKCKEHVPETANTDALKKKYAEMLDKVAATAKEGAKASQEDRLDDAKKAYAALGQLKKDGHKIFIPEDK